MRPLGSRKGSSQTCPGHWRGPGNKPVRASKATHGNVSRSMIATSKSVTCIVIERQSCCRSQTKSVVPQPDSLQHLSVGYEVPQIKVSAKRWDIDCKRPLR
jgi:hypothetical protein